MRLGTDTASVTNHLMSGTKGAPVPAVGMGCTVLMWTDRHAGTIVSVKGGCIGMQRDKATRADSNGMSDDQSYDYAPNPAARVEYYTLRKNGAYVRRGDTMNGQRLRVGDRNEYHDYSF